MNYLHSQVSPRANLALCTLPVSATYSGERMLPSHDLNSGFKYAFSRGTGFNLTGG